MSTYHGLHRSFCSCDLQPLGIALRFTLEARPSKNVRPSKQAARLVSRLLSSIHRRSASKRQLEIGSSWLFTSFSHALQQLTASRSSTRFSKQLRFDFGTLQRNPRRAVQPVPSEASRHEKFSPGSPGRERYPTAPRVHVGRQAPLLALVGTIRKRADHGGNRSQQRRGSDAKSRGVQRRRSSWEASGGECAYSLREHSA